MINLDSWFAFFILVLPSLKMYAISQFPVVDDMLDWLGVFSCALLLLLCLTKRNNLIVPKGCKFIFAFFAVYLLSTALHYNENLLGLISESSKSMIVVLYLILSFNSGEHSFIKTLNKFRKIYLIILSVDSLCLLVEVIGLRIYESNVYTVLGMDNYAAFSIIPMLTIVFYVSYMMKGKIQRIDKMVFLGCMLAKVATYSFAAIIAMVVMALTTYVLMREKEFRKIISPKLIVAVVIILIIGVVYFQFDKKIDLILAGAGKGISNRTAIWTKTLKSLPKSPIIGFGSMHGVQFKLTTGFRLEWSTTETHPHNFILAILFYTGIVGLMLYIGMFNQLTKFIRNNTQNKITSIVLGGVVGFLILSIPDGYLTLPSIYVFLTVIYLENKRSRMRCKTVASGNSK